jgi:hypothetical protein
MTSSISLSKKVLPFLLLGLLLPKIASSVKIYSEPMALTALFYSAAAYCAYEDIFEWSCGPACNGTTGDNRLE